MVTVTDYLLFLKHWFLKIWSSVIHPNCAVLLCTHIQNNTENQWCSVCKAGSFSLSAEHPDGCIPCTCMGISKECTRALFAELRDQLPVPIANQSLIYLATTSGVKADGCNVSFVNVNNISMIQCQLLPNTSVYWKDPSLYGNLLTFYGSTVYFTVNWIAINASDSGWPINPRAILIGRRARSFHFETSQLVLPNVTSSLKFTIAASAACELVTNFSRSRCSREDLLMALTDVQAVLIPASYYTSAHTSRYELLSFTTDSLLLIILQSKVAINLRRLKLWIYFRYLAFANGTLI